MGSTVQINAGSIYSYRLPTGEFAILKILVIEGGCVHVRLFENRYSQRPSTLDLGELKAATNHIPLSEADFRDREPAFLVGGAVTEDEMAIYRKWRGR